MATCHYSSRGGVAVDTPFYYLCVAPVAIGGADDHAVGGRLENVVLAAVADSRSPLRALRHSCASGCVSIQLSAATRKQRERVYSATNCCAQLAIGT